MLPHRTTTALILTSLLATACRTDPVQGVLVAGFVDEEPSVRTVVIPASEDGELQLHYVLEGNDRICVMTGEVPLRNLFLHSRCDGVTGTGKLSCNDGRSLNLEWTLTSCNGGYGRSMEFAGPTFFFGFDANEEKARQQMKKAQAEPRPSNERSFFDSMPGLGRLPLHWH